MRYPTACAKRVLSRAIQPVFEPLEGRRNWEGTLAGFADGAVAVETEPGNTRQFPLSEIQKANLKFEW